MLALLFLDKKKFKCTLAISRLLHILVRVSMRFSRLIFSLVFILKTTHEACVHRLLTESILFKLIDTNWPEFENAYEM